MGSVQSQVCFAEDNLSMLIQSTGRCALRNRIMNALFCSGSGIPCSCLQVTTSRWLQQLSIRHEVDWTHFAWTTDYGYGGKDRGQRFVFMAIHFAMSQVFVCVGTPFCFWFEKSVWCLFFFFFFFQQENSISENTWASIQGL